MSRREPPPQATWMLENLTSGRRDEALAGDLLEEFRSGRSDGWYWRQVLSACAVSWSKSLAVRGPALAFALLWSALAPAWEVIVDRITVAPVFVSARQALDPIWLPLALVGWIAFHAAFLWSGILAYLLAHTLLGKAVRRGEARRAFWLAPLICPPIAGVTFVLAKLYWYSWPGLAQAKLAATSMGQIADFGILPDLIRIPYFLALLVALWTALPQSKRVPGQFPAGSSGGGLGTDVLTLESTHDLPSVRRFFAFMVVAGFINALIAGFLLCRLPDAEDPTMGSLLLRAICYVAVGGAAGAMGAYVYWQNPASPFRENPPVPFPLFALVCVAGWVWVPAMVIFSEALSAGAALVAMIGAFLLAAGLRGATFYLLAPASSRVLHDDPELFEEALYQAPTDLIGYAIAICLYTAVVALAARWNLSAAALLALAAALFGWKKTIPQGHPALSVREYRRVALRVAFVAIPAILVTAWALLDGVAYRNRARTGTESAALSSASRQSPAEKETAKNSAYGVNGYQSVVLWPYPEKKQIVLPQLRATAWFAPGAARPVVIRFTGAYWYLQPPDQLPGPRAHQAFGSPLKANIQTSDDIPLVMDAHQTLSEEVPTARCRAIAVDIENFDNKEGPISVALLLGDAISAPRRTLYLGQQPIVSTQPQHFWFKAAPVSETLHFNLPARANLQKFNELTVVILPDAGHLFVGRRIAVRQFQLIPR